MRTRMLNRPSVDTHPTMRKIRRYTDETGVVHASCPYTSSPISPPCRGGVPDAKMIFRRKRKQAILSAVLAEDLGYLLARLRGVAVVSHLGDWRLLARLGVAPVRRSGRCR